MRALRMFYSAVLMFGGVVLTGFALLNWVQRDRGSMWLNVALAILAFFWACGYLIGPKGGAA